MQPAPRKPADPICGEISQLLDLAAARTFRNAERNPGILPFFKTGTLYATTLASAVRQSDRTIRREITMTAFDKFSSQLGAIAAAVFISVVSVMGTVSTEAATILI